MFVYAKKQAMKAILLDLLIYSLFIDAQTQELLCKLSMQLQSLAYNHYRI